MYAPQHPHPSTVRRDRGNILPLTLIMMVVGSLIVVALSTFAITLLRNRPPLEDRSSSLEAVRSAMRMAIVMQLEHGAEGCYDASTPTFTVNGQDVAIECEVLDNEQDNGGRFGLIATSNNGFGNGVAPGNESIKVESGNVAKSVLGSVFVNGGNLGGASSLVTLVGGELLASTYTSVGTPAARYTSATNTLTTCGDPSMVPEAFIQTQGDGVVCEQNAPGQPWWAYAGWKPDALPDYIYPLLPQVPAYPRSPTPIRIGSTDCKVFYPGRYNSPIVLNNTDQYYFASGVYLLNEPLQISNGARVVGGEGTHRGCAFDADAAFLAGSPRNHEITGKGVTFLLAENGAIHVNSASLRVNNRIATNSTRASAGISVMSVNEATGTTSPSDVEIPANDRVLLPDCLASQVAVDPDCAQDISTYSITPVAGATPVSYDASGLDANDVILSATLNGSVRESNRLVLDGHVFVPNAAVDLRTNSTGDNYTVRMGDGAVASTFYFDFPNSADNTFLIGAETASIYQKVKLVGTTTLEDSDLRSVVEFEIDSLGRYAINSWTVDAGDGGDLTGGLTGGDGSGDGPSTESWIDVIDRSGPIAHWRLGESAGATTAVDRIGTLDGTYTGSPVPTLGLAGHVVGDSNTAAGFGVAANTRVVIGEHPQINTSSRAVRTVELLFEASSIGGRQIVYEEGGSANGMNVYIDGSTLHARAWTTSWDNELGANLAITAGRSYHVMVVLDASTARGLILYVDGVAVGSSAKPDAEQWAAHSNGAGIGALSGTTKFHDGTSVAGTDYRFNGVIDEVVLYNAALSHTTVADHYVAATGEQPVGATTTTTTTSTTTTSTTAPVDLCSASDPTWYGEYFNDEGFASYVGWRNDPAINFFWGNGSPPGVDPDTFSIRWTRTVSFDEPGTYRFTTGGDDGVRLWVDGNLVIDQWGLGAHREFAADVVISDRCDVDIRMDYFERTSLASATLDWARIG